MSIKRTKIIAGNWKMNYGPRQASSFVREILPPLGQMLHKQTDILTILCPPAISLPAVQEVLTKLPTDRLELGAQNIYFEEKGAYTGELSPDMVKEICTRVILGHSERRALFGETDELINRKTLAAFTHSLRPIVCIGENLQQYEAGETDAIIAAQVKNSLAHIPAQYASDLVIAYEPIWAIGTGRAATAEGANRVISRIRQLYSAMYGDTAAAAIRILYGGSVTSANISEFLAYPDIDGALVGGASIKPDFVEIVRKSIEV
jgi:triosephosphate isomerase